jgi:RNAse (barnase) inhibitor barstar
MKGIIKSDGRGWKVLYTEHNPKIMVKQYNKSLPLHPDDLWAVDHTGQIMGIIQEVEFEMAEVLTDDITIYAKLINSKKETLYTKDDVIFAIQEAYGHGRDEADDILHEQVDESIRVILKCLDEKKNK